MPSLTLPPSIILKPGREKAVLRKHPWIYSGAISLVNGYPSVGETVRVLDSGKEFLAWAAYSPASQIRARIWSWEEQDVIDENFFYHRIMRAVDYRQEVISSIKTNAVRLIHAESDGLPGLIVDRYAHALVIQCLSGGAERWRDVISDHLLNITGADWIYERSDVTVRELEGLSERKGLLRARGSGKAIKIPKTIEIFEDTNRYLVDVVNGQKTGFYLDQRRNRAKLGQLAIGKNVLDCFSYTGGFTISALNTGANHVVSVDSSPEALGLLERNLELNQIPPEKVSINEGDVFQVLRNFRDRGRSFDLIVLDPPKFAPTESQVHRAARGYKDINLLALKLLVKGGYLVTFSCSGGISPDLFQKIVAGAAVDAGVDGLLCLRLDQDIDHPVGIHFPEGKYLKGLVIKVV